MCQKDQQGEQAALRSSKSAGRAEVQRWPQPPELRGEEKQEFSGNRASASESLSNAVNTTLPYTQCRGRCSSPVGCLDPLPPPGAPNPTLRQPPHVQSRG